MPSFIAQYVKKQFVCLRLAEGFAKANKLTSYAHDRGLAGLNMKVASSPIDQIA
jgi:hypothetical protein